MAIIGATKEFNSVAKAFQAFCRTGEGFDKRGKIMKVVLENGSVPIKAWVGEKECGALDIEDEAITQAKNLARMPFIARNGVALMPDVHAGKGSTIGSVIATEKAIIPAAVGVDIGCGMNAVRLSLKASDLPDSLLAIRNQIEANVPLGAGRAMSRSEARRRFSLTDLVAQTEGVECRKDAAVIDEIPAAYKDIDKVMENQKDLVEVLHTLKQVMCVKGA